MSLAENHGRRLTVGGLIMFLIYLTAFHYIGWAAIPIAAIVEASYLVNLHLCLKEEFLHENGGE